MANNFVHLNLKTAQNFNNTVNPLQNTVIIFAHKNQNEEIELMCKDQNGHVSQITAKGNSEISNIYFNKIMYQPLTFKATASNSKIKIKKNGTPRNIIFTYSTDGITWNNYNILQNESEGFIELNNIDDFVQFKGEFQQDSQTVSDENSYYQFVMEGQIQCSGTVNSLIGYNDVYEYCFYKLFYGCESLTIAPLLISESLINNCYSHMFEGCTNLSYIKVNFTEWETSCTSDWLENTNTLETSKFVKPSSLSDINDNSHIPNSWERINY